MGCGETLFVGDGGRITCSFETCRDPAAVDEILGERETEHVVFFGDESFTIRHPLKERRRNELETCALHEYIQGLAGPPVKPGTYRATPDGFGWAFEEMAEHAA